jgi:hypothetical protein
VVLPRILFDLHRILFGPQKTLFDLQPILFGPGKILCGFEKILFGFLKTRKVLLDLFTCRETDVSFSDGF